MDDNKILFDYGLVCMTKGIGAHDKEKPSFHNELVNCFNRHIRGDFGLLEEEDIKANMEDIKNHDGRVLSRYSTSEGDIYINTQSELYDMDKDNKPIFKIITMIMFCEEY